MQREIKFRAYHSIGEKKQMTEGVQPLAESLTNDSDKLFCMVPMQGIVFNEPTGRKRYWYEIEVDAIMEYIGIKDKNGKEIYEGDILKGDNQSMCAVKWVDSLTWDSGGSSHPGFYCEEWMEETDLDYHSSFRDVEVIGNIYENPELLPRAVGV